MAIQTDIDIFINKAQSKIALIGDDMLIEDSSGLDISGDFLGIEELDEAVTLFQNRPVDFTDLRVYDLITYLNFKYSLTVLPLATFTTNHFSLNVLLPGGGYLIGPQGPMGLIGPTGTPGANGTNGTNGTNGAAGTNGVNGTNGVAGSNGTNGVDGAAGSNGIDGVSSYVYIAYASDNAGTSFSNSFNSALDYIAVKHTTTQIASPAVGDFAGLWKNYKGAKGDSFTVDAQGLLSNKSTYDAQPKGFTYLATDTGNIYIKNSNTSGDWSGAISFVGDKGWSPIISLVSDGARRVLQIIDWTGGGGTKPSTTNQFIGSSGIVSTAAAAVDIRGVGSFTVTNGSFVQPAVGVNVSVTVLDTLWIAVGQNIFIETGGYYQVVSVDSPTTLTLKNLNYPGNAIATTVIATTKKTSPGGVYLPATWGFIAGFIGDQPGLPFVFWSDGTIRSQVWKSAGGLVVTRTIDEDGNFILT